MKGTKAVVGVFTYFDDLLKAIKSAKDAKYDYRVYSPVPHHELEHVTYPSRSPIRFISGTGAVCGLIGGFTLAIWTSMDWPLRVSAKDIVSVPGFVVIGYECTILLGAVSTLLAMFHFCRLPDLFRKVGFDPRFTQDKFGIVIGCDPKEVDTVKDKLSHCGADEVLIRDGL